MFGTYQLPMLKGSQVFPNTMRAPATVQIIIMDRLDLWHDHAQDMVDAGHRIVRSHLGQITSFFQGQRQNYSLSIIQSSKTRLALPKLEVEYYCMPNGQEHLTIVVDPASDVLAKKTEEDLCLLVLYDGNKVAAIPMGSLPNGGTVYSATLKHSSWGTDRLRTSQLKLQEKFSVVMSPISVAANGVISVGANHSVTNLSAANPLRDFAASDTDKAGWPLINGSAAGGFYTSNNSYTIVNGKAQVQDSHKDWISGAYAIAPDGTYYFGAYALFNGFGALARLNLGNDDHANQALFGPALPSMSAQYNDPIGGGANGVYIAYTTQNDVVSVIAPASVIGITGLSWTASVAAKIPWPVYSNNGKVDTIEIEQRDVTITNTHWTDDADFHNNYDETTIKFGSHSLYQKTFADGRSAGDVQDFGNMFSFPPSPKTKPEYYIEDKGADAGALLSTPYGQTTIASANGPYDYPDLTLWMHISNGKHFIQAFELNGVAKFYFDGSPFTPSVKGNIQMMIMDVPLSRIKDFV